jgi:hypothetical protein
MCGDNVPTLQRCTATAHLRRSSSGYCRGGPAQNGEVRHDGDDTVKVTTPFFDHSHVVTSSSNHVRKTNGGQQQVVPVDVPRIR